MSKKFICIIIAILLLMPLVSAFSLTGLFNWITGKAAAEETCIDADDGLNYHIRGTTYGLTHTPTGVEKIEKTDYCDEYGQLMEYYCGYHNNEYYLNDVYIKIPVYHCPNGCKDGACAGFVITCTDSDGGFDYFVRGSTTGTLSNKEKYANPDHCSLDGKGLYENYCVGNTTAGVTYYQCNCKDGACVKENVTCTDSDGGLNYYVKGIIKQSLPDGGTEYNYEICLDDGITVTEKYCNDKGEVVYEEYKCPYGCKDGACLKENVTCTDSDGGKDYYVKGIVTEINKYTNWKPNTYSDMCVYDLEGVNLAEAICEKRADGNYYGSQVHFNCPLGCSDGACIKENITCTDTDGGKDYYVKGTATGRDAYGGNTSRIATYTDRCDGNRVMEFFCENNYVTMSNYPCPYGCSNGACVKEAPVNVTCIDSEVGINPREKGTVTYVDGSSNTDTCIDDELSRVVNSGNYLTEYHCEGYGKRIYRCVCEDGACLYGEYEGCYDSDAHLAEEDRYYTKGFILTNEIEKENIYKDICWEGGLYHGNTVYEGPAVKEFDCRVEEGGASIYTCPSGCKDGACIKTCPAITGWRIKNGLCISDSGCDYNPSKYVYYDTFEECQKHLECIPKWECVVTPITCPQDGKQTKKCKDLKCGMEQREEIITCVPEQCSGCLYNATCLPYGQRLKIRDISAYCSIDSVFRPQMFEGAECENDYECLSDECSNGKCISTYTLLQKIFELLKTIVGKGWLWGE